MYFDWNESDGVSGGGCGHLTGHLSHSLSVFFKINESTKKERDILKMAVFTVEMATSEFEFAIAQS